MRQRNNKASGRFDGVHRTAATNALHIFIHHIFPTRQRRRHDAHMAQPKQSCATLSANLEARHSHKCSFKPKSGANEPYSASVNPISLMRALFATMAECVYATCVTPGFWRRENSQRLLAPSFPNQAIKLKSDFWTFVWSRWSSDVARGTRFSTSC